MTTKAQNKMYKIFIELEHHLQENFLELEGSEYHGIQFPDDISLGVIGRLRDLCDEAIKAKKEAGETL